MAPAQPWTPYNSLTQAPTNLKEAIDWVLRVTGRDGKENKAAQPPQKPEPGPHCLCYLAKAVKDLLYDARSPGSPAPHPDRYWDNLLLEQEKDIVKPVLTDLGLLSGSTSAASSTCAGGTEVIKALIDQLALGLQKWVRWQEGDQCCLKGTEGIGKNCGTGTGCCGGPIGGSHDCSKCGNGETKDRCYLSAYRKNTNPKGTSDEHYLWTSISSDSTKVHLLARIFLGSVCLIWSGLSQLGFLTGGSGRGGDYCKEYAKRCIQRAQQSVSSCGYAIALLRYNQAPWITTTSLPNTIEYPPVLYLTKPPNSPHSVVPLCCYKAYIKMSGTLFTYTNPSFHNINTTTEYR